LRPTGCRSAAASALGRAFKRNDLAREAVGCNGVFGRIVAEVSTMAIDIDYDTLIARFALVFESEPMRLILIRHAASQHSLLGRVADIRTCTGLTELGVQQAHQLAQRFQASRELGDCQALLSSPVRRARETAAILMPSLKTDIVTEDHSLREIHPGRADGMTWQDYQATYGGFDLIAEPTRLFAPQGESWQAFLERVHLTLQRLASEYEAKTVVTVTHAGFIVASMLVLFAIPRPGTNARFEPRHTALTVWEVTAGKWQLECYNDTWHLDRR
jgi:2,3-bisphosphoglycerate-dependent phosphoglycerate mutase